MISFLNENHWCIFIDSVLQLHSINILYEAGTLYADL